MKNMTSSKNNGAIDEVPLLPVLVYRFRKFNKRVIAPLHCHQSTWNKHGYLCLSPFTWISPPTLVLFHLVELTITI
jgi:hypothetical protein